MIRTALLACVLVLTGYASANWLTRDFQIWTAEGARRLEVAQHTVPVPFVTVDGPGITPQTLPALLEQDGRVTIIDFFYTRCMTVCLSLGTRFQQMQAALEANRTEGAQPGVRLLSISFDGAHDTSAQLQAYAHRLHADQAVWRFLRVPDAAEQRALLQRLGVVVVPDGRGDFEHNAALLVLDAGGRLVRIFDLTEQQLALDFARHLAKGGAL